MNRINNLVKEMTALVEHCTETIYLAKKNATKIEALNIIKKYEYERQIYIINLTQFMNHKILKVSCDRVSEKNIYLVENKIQIKTCEKRKDINLNKLSYILNGEISEIPLAYNDNNLISKFVYSQIRSEVLI